MQFSELPVEARRYILYHALVSPVLIIWYALPFYLLKTGYSVLEVGLIFTIAQLLGVPVTLWLGRVFTRVDMRRGLIAIDLMESLSSLLYYLAYGPLAPVMVVLGELVENASSTLYFLYPAYERIIYPEDRMKEALAWHLRLPELAVIISYPIIGYVLGYVCSLPECFRMLFLFFAVYQLLLVPYIYYYFKPVVLEEGEDNNNSRREGIRGYWRRYKYYIIADILFIAAWRLAPGLALVYFIIEWIGGNMFHVALVEAAISTATLTGTWITDKISSGKSFKALQAGTVVTILGLMLMVSTKYFILTLIASYILRIGDTIVFVFKRTWLYTIMSKSEASKVSAALSSIRKIISILSPFMAGALAYFDPRAPYITCIILLVLTIPVYLIASKKTC